MSLRKSWKALNDELQKCSPSGINGSKVAHLKELAEQVSKDVEIEAEEDVEEEKK